MNAQQRYELEQREKGVNNDTYNAMIADRRERMQETNRSLNMLRRTGKGGMVKGRKQDGVRVISGNPEFVFSDTRADGTRNNNRPSGVPTVNSEASKMGAPIAYVPETDDDQLFFEQPTSPGDKASEM